LDSAKEGAEKIPSLQSGEGAGVGLPALEMRGIAKRFEATQALDGVTLTLYPGEVHALLGENGAGKSTLIKIMTGMHPPDTGQIFRDGQPVLIENALHAQRLGIAAIYQEPRIFPDLSVAENLFIAQAGRGSVVNWRTLYSDAEQTLARMNVTLDVRRPARGLSLAMLQTVEIARALSLNARVLVMDEPTASLSAHEVEQLFALIRMLRAHGVAILFISHRLEEIFEIADRVTIFRDGRLISTQPVSEITTEGAIRDMVGRSLEAYFVSEAAARPIPGGEPLLKVEGLHRDDTFSGITFDIKRGEIVGFAGLVGARRTDVGLALFGIAPADAGTIEFEGQAQTIHSPEQAMALGIAYVPEDRHKQGLVLPMTISDNVTLPTLRRFVSKLGLIRRKMEDQIAQDYRNRLSIRTVSVHMAANKLSGGNQQKVVLAKWLNAHPKLLILDEPTRGIDVGAKAEVHQIIHQLAAQGLGILLISSDLPEVLAMSDRIVVMREGRQVALFTRAEATPEKVIGAAIGQGEETSPPQSPSPLRREGEAI
jgi:rhamnose transport system ATP-binding protein